MFHRSAYNWKKKTKENRPKTKESLCESEKRCQLNRRQSCEDANKRAKIFRDAQKTKIFTWKRWSQPRARWDDAGGSRTGGRSRTSRGRMLRDRERGCIWRTGFSVGLEGGGAGFDGGGGARAGATASLTLPRLPRDVGRHSDPEIASTRLGRWGVRAIGTKVGIFFYCGLALNCVLWNRGSNDDVLFKWD